MKSDVFCRLYREKDLSSSGWQRWSNSYALKAVYSELHKVALKTVTVSAFAENTVTWEMNLQRSIFIGPRPDQCVSLSQAQLLTHWAPRFAQAFFKAKPIKPNLPNQIWKNKPPKTSPNLTTKLTKPHLPYKAYQIELNSIESKRI